MAKKAPTPEEWEEVQKEIAALRIHAEKLETKNEVLVAENVGLRKTTSSLVAAKTFGDSVTLPAPHDTTDLEIYLAVARALREENKDNFKDLDDAIDKCRKFASEKRPFILLDGSSGVGKTQTALATPGKFLYFVLSRSELSSQNVYRPFHFQSEVLDWMVDKDMKSYRVFAMADLQDTYAFYTLGWLYALWTSCNNTLQQAKLSLEWSVESMTIPQFLDKCPNFMMVLDEFPYLGQDGELKRRMRFLRAIGRRVGVVMLLGTDSVICNVVDGATRNESDSDQLWCIAITRFPKCTMKSLTMWKSDLEEFLEDLPVELHAFFMHVLSTHRPYFTLLLIKALVEEEGKTKEPCFARLERVCDNIARRIWNAKQGSDGFLLGQVRLFQPNYLEKSRQSIDLLIRRHFAKIILGIEKDGVMELSVGKGSNHLIAFDPAAVFPRATEEVLLYMCLMGTPSRPPFAWRNKTFRTSAHDALQTRYGSSQEVDRRNSNAASNDPNDLEALLATAVSVASHYAGFKGQQVCGFLAALFFELGGPRTEISPSLASLFPPDQVVPYMSSCNNEWPTALLLFSGVCVATMTRPKNKDQIDLECEITAPPKTSASKVARLTGECKNVKTNVSLVEICLRIPATSTLHLVLTKKPYTSVQHETEAKLDEFFIVRLLLDDKGLWDYAVFGSNAKQKACTILLIDSTSMAQFREALEGEKEVEGKVE